MPLRSNGGQNEPRRSLAPLPTPWDADIAHILARILPCTRAPYLIESHTVERVYAPLAPSNCLAPARPTAAARRLESASRPSRPCGQLTSTRQRKVPWSSMCTLSTGQGNGAAQWFLPGLISGNPPLHPSHRGTLIPTTIAATTTLNGRIGRGHPPWPSSTGSSR